MNWNWSLNWQNIENNHRKQQQQQQTKAEWKCFERLGRSRFNKSMFDSSNAGVNEQKKKWDSNY